MVSLLTRPYTPMRPYHAVLLSEHFRRANPTSTARIRHPLGLLMLHRGRQGTSQEWLRAGHRES
jgi:hypothetical protein